MKSIMGRFDHINYKMDCPTCGKEVSDFQSKCLRCFFDKIEFWEVDRFYSSCNFCNTWIEFNLNRSLINIPIDAYEMTIECLP